MTINTVENSGLDFSIAGVEKFKGSSYFIKLDKRCVEYASQLTDGQLSIGYDSIQSLPYRPDDLNNFDWSFKNYTVTNTYLLYVYGLRQVYILAKAYLTSKDSQYINLAWNFIESLYKHIFSENDKNPFLFNDHAVAERCENLVFFGFAAEKSGVVIDHFLLNKLIMNSCEWLANNKNYQFNHNHGIIVDKSLIIGAYCLNSEKSKFFLAHAIERLKAQIQFAYGSDGVHVENSFDYHLITTNLLLAIRNCLIFMKDPYATEVDITLHKSLMFLIYGHKPNLQRPLIGDTIGVKENGRGIIDAYGLPQLEYIRSLGKEGAKPEKRSMYFENSGYVFFREHFESENFEKATWLSLKAGYKSRVHKHQDDLSITLYSKGYDILVDAGMFNFMPGDRYKNYMESIPAHSTIGIVNKPYSIARANGEKFSLQEVKYFEEYDYALASSRVYPGCVIYRHIYYFRKEDAIVIRDEVFAQEAENFGQYFHFGPLITASVIDKNRSVLNLADSGYAMVLKQLISVDRVITLDGQDSSPMSLFSTGFADFVETKTLQYEKSAKKFEFITSLEIKLVEQAMQESLDCASLKNGYLMMGDNQIFLEQSVPVSFTGVKIHLEKKNLSIQTKLTAEQKREFSLYIYDHDSQKNIAKLPYVSTQEINFTLPKEANYDLLYYVSNGKGEKLKGIVGTIRKKWGKWIISRTYNVLHYPIVGQITVDQTSRNHYKFEIPVTYDFPFQIRWWIYRNGTNIACVDLKNKASFNYEFSQKGDYVVMCSVSDSYFGEINFSQTEIITID